MVSHIQVFRKANLKFNINLNLLTFYLLFILTLYFILRPWNFKMDYNLHLFLDLARELFS